MKQVLTLDQFLSIMEQSNWQDLALSAGNIFFCLTLVPMLRHPEPPPLLTSVPTALALLAGGAVFASLHLWITALTQIVAGLQWLAMAFKKSPRSVAESTGGLQQTGSSALRAPLSNL
jgi:hypothetical protein